MAVDEAIASGARALFGEKYGEEVRVVAMGEGGGNTIGWSVELCGGTHVRRAGDIGLVTVTSESAVAAGVRRIEAMTGDAARHYLSSDSRRLRDLASLLRVPIGEIDARLTQLVDERRRLERDLSETRKKLAMGAGASVGGDSDIVDVNGTKFFRKHVTGFANTELKALADEGKVAVGSGVVAIVNTAPDGKGGLVVGVTDDLISQYNAVDLVRKGAQALGGKGGGGRPDLAQAGGPDGSKAQAALAAIEKALAGG